jgi:hypothetical protein
MLVNNDYTLRTVADAAEWHALFSRVEMPHMVQTWAYGEAKRVASGWRTRRVILDAGGWRPRRLVISRRDDPVAICQLLDKSPGRLTLASRLNRGPLFLGADPDDDVIKGVYATLMRHTLRPRRPLIVAPAIPDAPEFARMLTEIGYRPRAAEGWRSDRVDLRPDDDEILANFHRDWRRRIRAATRDGVEFGVCDSPAGLEWVLERHAEHMAENQYAGLDPDFIRALRDAAPPDDFLVYDVRHRGRRVGGSLVYRFGKIAEGLVLWVSHEGRAVNAGRYMDWCTCLDLKRRGCEWFDLGGKRPGATETFKAGMGGVEYCLLHEWWTF